MLIVIGQIISSDIVVCVCVCVCVCARARALVRAQSYPTLCNPMDCSPTGSSVHGMDSPGKKTGVGCYALLQGIFLTQGSNSHLQHFLHCQVDSLPLSHLGSHRYSYTKQKIYLMNFGDWCLFNFTSNFLYSIVTLTSLWDISPISQTDFKTEKHELFLKFRS